MNPRTRVIVSEFWEFLSFFVNLIVFLLIGDQIRFAILGENLGTIALTVGAMILTRAIAIYGLSFVSNRLTQSDISIPDQTILWWGGLRGSVSIALALSIPIMLPEREKVIATVFGVVLFTLLIQGLTIQPLLKKLNLLGNQPIRQRYAEAIARQTAFQQVMHYLEAIEQRPGIDPEFYRYQTAFVQGELTCLQTEIEQLLAEYPDLRTVVVNQVRSELQAIEAETYAEFVRAGQLNRELSPFLQQAAESKD